MTALLILTAALFAGLALALVFATLAARWRIAVGLTPVEHALIAAAVQVGWGLTAGDWIAGGVMGVLLFVGREHAQAECRYINAHGGSRHATPREPAIGCLHPRYWSTGSVLDIVVPAAVCLAIGVIAHAVV